MYQQFVTGLGVRGGPAPQGASESLALQAVIADRKVRWRDACKGDPDVVFHDDLVAEVKRTHGSNSAVDDILLEGDATVFARYARGKNRKEVHLRASGLSRGVDGQIVLADNISITTTPISPQGGVGGAQAPLVASPDLSPSRESGLVKRIEELLARAERLQAIPVGDQPSSERHPVTDA